MPTDSPRVESFVLRFVQDAPNDGAVLARHWHVVVVHVQTNEEKIFTDFADAVAFISRYVPLGDFVFQNDRRPQTTDRRDESGQRSAVGGQSGE